MALGQVYGVLALCLAGRWVAAQLDRQRGQSLYCGILLTYWLVRLPREQALDQPEPEGELVTASAVKRVYR